MLCNQNASHFHRRKESAVSMAHQAVFSPIDFSDNFSEVSKSGKADSTFEQISGAPNILVVQKCCFAGCRLLGGQGDGLPGMGVPKLAVAPHKLLTQPHKHGSYRIIKYQTIPDHIVP